MSVDLASMARQNLITSSRLNLACNASLDRSADCLAFNRHLIEFSREDASCPFDAKICATAQGFSVDTGYLDTQRDLGINSRPEDAVGFRRSAVCAPLVTNGYTSAISSNSAPAGLTTLEGYYYGPNRRTSQAFTFAFDSDASKTAFGTTVDDYSYQVE